MIGASAIAIVAAVLASEVPAQTKWAEPRCRALREIHSQNRGDTLGWLVRPVGDIDADGTVDLVAAAPFWSLNVGEISAWSGKTGKQLWRRRETRQSSILGHSLETVADLDADGVRDVLAGAPFHGQAGGFVHAYSGKTGKVLRTFAGARRFDSLGSAIATGGDWNGDRIPDFALAAMGDDTKSRNGGRVFVYSTKTFALLATLDPQVAGDERFGTALEFIGDIDADGRDELAVGVRNGRGGRIDVLGHDGKKTVRRYAIAGIDFGSAISGDRMSAGGDLDGDGFRDIWVGEGFSARARIFSGKSGKLLRSLSGTPGRWFGQSGGIVPDVNGDGIPDLVTGELASRNTGKVWVHSGRDARVLQTMTPAQADRGFGADVVAIGDVDRDGAIDFAVGATARGALGPPGALYIMQGEPCPAARQSYGSGLGGTRGVPSLVVSADPVFKTTVQIEMGNSAGRTTWSVLAVGASRLSVPTPWGGSLLVVPTVVVPGTLPANGARVPLALPRAGCARVFLQTFLGDAGARRGVAESRGLELRLGH